MNRLAFLILAVVSGSLLAQPPELTPETLKTIRKAGGRIVVDSDPSKWHVEVAQGSHDSQELPSLPDTATAEVEAVGGSRSYKIETLCISPS